MADSTHTPTDSRRVVLLDPAVVRLAESVTRNTIGHSDAYFLASEVLAGLQDDDGPCLCASCQAARADGTLTDALNAGFTAGIDRAIDDLARRRSVDL